MTLEELNQLQYLRKYIEHERDRLKTMHESLDVQSPILSNMPKASGASDKIGDKVPDIVDEARMIEESIKKCEEMESRLIQYINKIPNVKIKMLMTLRFVDGMSWNDVADYADNGNGKMNADNCRMAVNSYLRRGESRSV